MTGIYFLLTSISAESKSRLYNCGMKNDKWEYLLHYEMTSLCKIEEELIREIVPWIKITTSPYYGVILQKVLLYAQEHKHQLNYLLTHKQISTISSHQSIIKMLAREIEEKLKFCSSVMEKEHCIMSNIAAISCLKNSFYDNCLTIARNLNNEIAASFFTVASANEVRVFQWTLERKKTTQETSYMHYLFL